MCNVGDNSQQTLTLWNTFHFTAWSNLNIKKKTWWVYLFQLCAIWTAAITESAIPGNAVAIRVGPEPAASNFRATIVARNTDNAGTARASVRKAGTAATALYVSNIIINAFTLNKTNFHKLYRNSCRFQLNCVCFGNVLKTFCKLYFPDVFHQTDKTVTQQKLVSISTKLQLFRNNFGTFWKPSYHQLLLFRSEGTSKGFNVFAILQTLSVWWKLRILVLFYLNVETNTAFCITSHTYAHICDGVMWHFCLPQNEWTAPTTETKKSVVDHTKHNFSNWLLFRSVVTMFLIFYRILTFPCFIFSNFKE